MEQQRLTASDVEAATRHLVGAAPARLLEDKDRNQVFAIGDQAVFKAYLADGRAKQARKIATLDFLAGRGPPVPWLLGHGIIPKANSGVPWTLETRVIAQHLRPGRGELDTQWGCELHRALVRRQPGPAVGFCPAISAQLDDVVRSRGHHHARTRDIRWI